MKGGSQSAAVHIGSGTKVMQLEVWRYGYFVNPAIIGIY